MIDTDEMTLRLSGTELQDGEITFSGLAELARALQHLTLRIGRHLTGQEGRGRSPAVVQRATELRLRGTAPGSTVLQVAIGDADALAATHASGLDEGLEKRSLDALLEIFDGVATDRAPAWVTPLLGEATVSVIKAFDTVSTRCEVSAPTRRRDPITFSPRSASRDVWAVTKPDAGRRSDVAVSGRLDLVDLQTGRFRIRDAVDNAVHLERVTDADEVARLVGELVTATGEAVLGTRGQVVSLVDATVDSTEWPDWTPPSLADVQFASTAPAAVGVDGVDDDEVAAFLALIRE